MKATFIVGSWCEFHAGDRAAVAASLERLEGIRPAGASPRLLAHRALLRALLAEGDGAGALFAEAVDVARRAGSPWPLATALGEQAAAGFDRDAAQSEARSILERLGATAALERIMSRPGDRPAAIAAG